MFKMILRKQALWPVVLFSLALLSLFGCKDNAEVKEQALAKVNDCYITEDRVLQRLSESVWSSSRPATLDDIKMVIDNEINRECLIQEAMKRGLHKEKAFREAIENYWSQTLITNLLNQKMNEIKNDVIVTEQDVNNYYETAYKAHGDTRALSDIKQEIFELLQEKKKSELIDTWINKLRKNSNVAIYEEKLKARGGL